MGSSITYTPSTLDVTVNRDSTFEDTVQKNVLIKISQKDYNLSITNIAVKTGDSLPNGVTVLSTDLENGIITFKFTKGGDLGGAEVVTAQTIFVITTEDGGKSEIVMTFTKTGKGVSLGRIATIPVTSRLENVTYTKPNGLDYLQSVVYAQSGDVVVLSQYVSPYSAGTVFRYNGVSWYQVDDVNSCFVAFEDVMKIADNSTANIICKTLVAQSAFINNLITKFVEIKDGGYIKAGLYCDPTKTVGFQLDTDGNAQFTSKDSQNNTRTLVIDGNGVTLSDGYADNLQIGIDKATTRWDNSSDLINYGSTKLKGQVMFGNTLTPCGLDGQSISTDNYDYFALNANGNTINNLKVPKSLTATNCYLTNTRLLGSIDFGSTHVLKGTVSGNTLTLEE